MDTNYYPIFLQLHHKLCVVIGGGEVATRKVTTLLECNATVRVISPQLTPELEALADAHRLEALRHPYTPESLAGAYLVIAATSSPAVNRQVATHCHANNIPINVVDAPELCDFIVPATVKRGPLTIAVSTGGNLPAMARHIRQVLATEFDEVYGELLTALGEARARVLRDINDPVQRKQIFTTLVTTDLLTTLRQEGRTALELKIEQIIHSQSE